MTDHSSVSSTKQVIVRAFSGDHGKTWSKPTILIETPGELDYDPSTLVYGNRRMASVMFNEALQDLTKKGIPLIDQKPRKGVENTDIVFLHPKGTGRVLLELVET